MKQNKPSLINGYAKETVESHTENKNHNNQEHKKPQFSNQKEAPQKHGLKEQQNQEVHASKKKVDQKCNDIKKCDDIKKKKSC